MKYLTNHQENLMFSRIDERRVLFVYKAKGMLLKKKKRCKFYLGVCFHHSLDFHYAEEGTLPPSSSFLALESS